MIDRVFLLVFGVFVVLQLNEVNSSVATLRRANSIFFFLRKAASTVKLRPNAYMCVCCVYALLVCMHTNGSGQQMTRLACLTFWANGCRTFGS